MLAHPVSEMGVSKGNQPDQVYKRGAGHDGVPAGSIRSPWYCWKSSK